MGVIAKKQYKYAPDSFELGIVRQKVLTRAGIPYWQPFWDEMLKMIARTRTFEYQRRHPEDPYPYFKKEKEVRNGSRRNHTDIRKNKRKQKSIKTTKRETDRTNRRRRY